MFADDALLPLLLGYRLNAGFLLALLAVPLAWGLLHRTAAGFRLRTVGQAPAAARYAGFSAPGAVWFSLVLSGALAGLAGVAEAAGPVGQLQPLMSPGYGFAAIIVAFLGRLHPLGILAASLLMALLYLGGEQLQVTMQLPIAATGTIQGMLLFFLLGTDVFVDQRLVLGGERGMPDGLALVALLVATLRAATPLLLAGFGELVAERSGVLNLGVEGMMLVGAAAGFIVTAATGSPLLGLLAAALAGALLALLFGVLTLTLQANQVACGLALTIFGVGLSALIGLPYQGTPITGLATVIWPDLDAADPFIQQLMLLDPVVWLALLLPVLVSGFLYRTRRGLVLRAVGESHDVAHALGYAVLRVRYAAVLFGGAMTGLAGAYLSLVYTPMWTENMVAGRGWIALALVVFSAWKPAWLALGAVLFGFVTIAQFHAEAFGLDVSPHLLSTLPYVATVVVLVLISRDATRLRLNAPAALGQPFRAGG